MELIRIKNVVKEYRVGELDVPVLRDVSFTVKRGEMVAIMGSSGSGKSTLMNILGCLDRPTAGEYWLDGEEVGRWGRDERAIVRTAKLGFVFQSFNLLARTTAVDNVLMPLDYSPLAPRPAVAHQRAVELLTRVGLAERLEHVPSKMSGGQQQRVAIARALVNEPALLLADEPTGNLDSKTSSEILRMFQQLNAEGLTIILVTHDPQVSAYAHRTIRMADGVIVEDAITVSRTITVPSIDAAETTNAGSDTEACESWRTSDGHDRSNKASSGGTALASPQVKLLIAKAAPVETMAPRPSKHSPGHRLPTTLRMATSAILRNKLRSGLTALGVVIGVAAVIAMVEISQGSSKALVSTMQTMGVNTILVQSGANASGPINFGAGSEKTLTPGDAAAILAECPSVASAAPVLQVQGQVVRGNRNWVPMNIYGSTPEYLDVREWVDLAEGEMFSHRDVRGANRICVIGRTIAEQLFEDESPVGQDIRIKKVTFKVAGVLSRKGANMIGMDQDDIVIAPWSTIKFRVSGTNSGGASGGSSATESGTVSTEVNSLNNLYPDAASLYPTQSQSQAANTPQPVRFVNVDNIMIKAKSAESVDFAVEEVTALLHERHRIRDDQENDFSVRNMAELMKALGSMTTVMGGLLLIVALISLAVGGVGIMNIMLVSVTERTREIGLRMAVGARGFHILRQFLVEAIVLCVMGGAAGVALGRTASFMVWWTLRWPIEPSWPAIAAAFLVSATVGVAFGFYPAWKASRLDPIEALRFE